jgi:hypothetical protein
LSVVCLGLSADEFLLSVQEARHAFSDIQDAVVLNDLRNIEAVGVLKGDGNDLAYVFYDDDWSADNARGLAGYYRVSHVTCERTYIDNEDLLACPACSGLLPILAGLETEHRQRGLQQMGITAEKVSVLQRLSSSEEWKKHCNSNCTRCFKVSAVVT